ncbi:MAG TPA: aminotransferase class I/II-fold pyridoxal phosphate-dependent enzyme, partial [Clostridia bacterium]|nr:aminotransferase class I/II-fold pyridoxal phosphate-dependent enzyme [Clostridia bacterium]
LRTGVAVGDEKVIRKMTIGKQAVDVHTSNLSQAIIDRYLRKNLLDDHLKEVIPVYREKKNTMYESMKKYMPTELVFTNPEGGLFIWGEFTNGLNVTDLFVEAVQATDTAYVSGKTFFASEDVDNTLRLNYSNASNEQIENGIKKLGDFFKKKIAENK